MSLSFTSRIVERAPTPVGVKTTMIVQLEFAARVVEQVPPERAQSPVLPVMNCTVIPVTGTGALLASVNVIGELDDPTATDPKDWLVGVTVTEAPVPVSVDCCGLEGSLSETLNVAVRVKFVVGVNVTIIVQDDEPARLEPQVPPLTAKSPGFAPRSDAEIPVTVELEEFVSVNVAFADPPRKTVP